MERIESRGLVLYNRNFREDDKLVKIFTEKAGKRMFFVKHASKSKLVSGIQPLTLATFHLKINDDGLSYIEDFQQVMPFKWINEDIFLLSYATYIVALADACLQDNHADPSLFAFLEKALSLMEEGLDYEILTNIFEIQLLGRFGVSLNFHECVFCHRVGLPFDFSYAYSGLLCPEHYGKDERRSHVDPNVLYLLDQFQSISFEDLKTISVKSDMKRKFRLFIDQIYEEYVGIHLKSKKFIDDLGSWGQIMRSDKGDEEEN
ncbi:DNA repair protein RecO [Streptococcus sp. X16XC17]|uniref:DNA repair protein RecO n=1 Tax=unclassified Streptococcus TaxID=2608887 RepID=UPI00066FD62E|nr:MULTISPECIES: DNA repair protein RecO [unclassified Streptococcus]TCD45894.1 DNA repair protein RecO [Streptococcus sp. X16XC17]